MILDEIILRTRKRVDLLPQVFFENSTRNHVSLVNAIRNRNNRNAIIAEIKCASPSRGIIRRNVDMAVMAGALATRGCVALSVLTEPYYFGGSGQDIAKVKSAVSIPVLRKDFIIDERQVAESLALGADAVLLIAEVLKERLPVFVDLALTYGLEPLVEVHNRNQVETALSTNAELIGINTVSYTHLRAHETGRNLVCRLLLEKKKKKKK